MVISFRGKDLHMDTKWGLCTPGCNPICNRSPGCNSLWNRSKPARAGTHVMGPYHMGADTWYHVNTAHYIVHHMSKRTVDQVSDANNSEPFPRRQRTDDDDDAMEVGGDSSEEFSLDLVEPEQLRPPLPPPHREPWQVARDARRNRTRRQLRVAPPAAEDFVDENARGLPLRARRVATAINAGPPLANYIQNALRRQANDRAPVRTNSSQRLTTTTTAPATLRQNLECPALQDEAVLTSFVIFGSFFDAGIPPEIIQLLCQWTITIYQSVQAIYFAYPHGPVFYPKPTDDENFGSMATYQPPLYLVDPSRGPMPVTVYSGCNDHFDFCTSPSLKQVDFVPFIERMFENVIMLCKIQAELAKLSSKWFEEVAAMISTNFPGCFYYVTPMVMENYGSVAKCPIPIIKFSLCDSKGNQVKGFEGFGLGFPPVYTAFINVVNEVSERHMDKRVLPGISSLELPHVVGQRVSGAISSPADIDKLTEDMRNLCMTDQYKVRVLPETPRRLVFKVNDQGGELSKFTFCINNKN